MWRRNKARTKSARSNVPTLSARALPYLLLAVGLSLLPHSLRLPWWLSGLFVMVASWRWYATLNNWPLPRQVLLTVMTLTIVTGLLIHYGTLLGRDAGVGLLTAMAAMKLLEARTVRDAMVLIFLSYFLLLANFLYGQSLLTGSYLFVVVVVLLAVQILVQQPRSSLLPIACLRLSGTMLLQALPIMLLMFVLFPRIPGPLWGLPNDAHKGLSGLSDTMSPGSISELIRSSEVAFRVQFHDADKIPLAEELYWRGPVLWRYYNHTWSSLEETLSDEFPYTPLDNPINYTITLEPNGKHWLFALDVPTSLPKEAGITNSFQLKTAKPINNRLRYSLRSHLRYRSPVLTAAEHKRMLQLPRGGNPRSRTLAQQWQQQAKHPRDIINSALDMFRNSAFYYTLTPPLLQTKNRIDEFLFDSQRGFCEFYASSFVYLMRAAGIPARVVLGYQGAERNGDYFIVRQSDAHAWSEVWLPESGWTRVDPTAAVAPERIENGLYAAADDLADLPLLARRNSSWLRQLALGWDKLNNKWNNWVLTYDNDRQKQFLSRLGVGPIAWREMMLALVAGLGLVALIASGWLLLRRRQRQDILSLSYQRFCRKLARHNQTLARQPHEGALAYSQRLAQIYPQYATQLNQIAKLYTQLRYSPKQNHNPSALRDLQQLIKALDLKAT